MPNLPAIKFKSAALQKAKRNHWGHERRRAYRKRNKLCIHCGGPRPCSCIKGYRMKVGEICLDCLGVGMHRAGCKRNKYPVDR